MNIVEQNKKRIIPHLLEWVETFNPENIIYNKYTIEEDEETEMFNNYESILNLIKRLENNQCSEKDFENIIFHIEQINYNEPKIVLL